MKLTPEQWLVVRDEYVHNSEISYRYLSSKYNVSLVTINNRANKEGWQDMRKRYADERALQNKNSPVTDAEADIYTLMKSLGQKIATALATVDPKNIAALRALTSSTKDLMEMHKKFKGDGSDDGEGTGVFLLPSIEASVPPPTEVSDDG